MPTPPARPTLDGNRILWALVRPLLGAIALFIPAGYLPDPVTAPGSISRWIAEIATLLLCVPVAAAFELRHQRRIGRRRGATAKTPGTG